MYLKSTNRFVEYFSNSYSAIMSKYINSGMSERLFHKWQLINNGAQGFSVFEGLNYETRYLGRTSNVLKSLIHEFATEDPS
jgi:hypothetical protein